MDMEAEAFRNCCRTLFQCVFIDSQTGMNTESSADASAKVVL